MRLLLCMALWLGCWATEAAAAAPEFTRARDLVSRWLDARQRGQADDYLKLYGAGCTVVWRAAGAAEEALDAAAHAKAVREAFRRGGAGVSVYVDQYAREKDGRITVAFRALAPRAGGQDALVILKLGEEGGGLRITREERTVLQPLGETGIPIGAGQVGVAEVLPKGFSAAAVVKCGRCARRDECACELRLGEREGARIPLGVFVNDPEGEFVGSYYGRLRAVPLISFGPVAGAVLVVVENGARDKDNEDRGPVQARRGTLIGKGPGYPLLWSGDLASFSRSRPVRYEARPGQKVEQRLAAPGAQEARACRLSLLSESAKGTPEMIDGCGR